MQPSDKRKYERHASDLPVTVMLEEVVASESSYLNNISEGGLSFNSMAPLDVGALIRIRIPVNRPVFAIMGKVVWCRKMALQYSVGVEFVSGDATIRQRVVILVREIAKYKDWVLAEEGRTLSSQEAALEWIAKCAAEIRAQSGDQGGEDWSNNDR